MRRTTFSLSVLALFCASTAASADAASAAEKGIKKDEARKLIAAVSLLELNKQAVTIKEISPPGAVVSVLASVKLAFRFVRGEAGAWHVAEVRTGDRQWEAFDLLARAFGRDDIPRARAELDAFAAELDGLGKKKGDAAGAGQSRIADEGESHAAKELKRGALSVKNPAAALSPLGSSAVVEVEVETSVDFARASRGRWQVARVRLGGYNFEAFDVLDRTLNAEKRARACADLDLLAAALDAHRRARGFYVVADSASTLVDHLNPRYTNSYIRFDPWHRPYEYEGTRERFTLRSLGADGKANTPDDVIVRKG